MYEINSIGHNYYSEFKQICFWKKVQAKSKELYDEQINFRF